MFDSEVVNLLSELDPIGGFVLGDPVAPHVTKACVYRQSCTAFSRGFFREKDELGVLCLRTFCCVRNTRLENFIPPSSFFIIRLHAVSGWLLPQINSLLRVRAWIVRSGPGDISGVLLCTSRRWKNTREASAFLLAGCFSPRDESHVGLTGLCVTKQPEL